MSKSNIVKKPCTIKLSLPIESEKLLAEMTPQHRFIAYSSTDFFAIVQTYPRLYEK